MMKVVWGIVPVLLLAACTRLPPPREYVLRPEARQALAPNAGQGMEVVVSPARLPEYLDRPYLPLPQGPSEIRFSDEARWADRPSDDITRVVADNLQTLLPAAVVTARPLPPTKSGRQVMVVLDISDMSLERGGAAMLKGRWSLLDGPGQQLLRTGTIQTAEPVTGEKDHQAQIAAMDANLLALSRDVALALTTLPGR